MNSKFRFVSVVVFIVLGIMVTSCATGSVEQGSKMSEASGSAAEAEAIMATDEHEADAHDDEHETEEHEHEAEEHGHDAEAEMLMLPELNATDLNGAPLRVIATTSIIGDVVAQVGGDAIDLTVLMTPGQDPHSYEPAAQDLTAVSSADVIFVNGWDLEENLVRNLESIGEEALIIPISANIAPRAFAEGDHDEHEGEEAEHEEEEDHEEGEHEHGGADPHVWFSVHNVEQWAENVEHVLSDLDPANATTFEANAAVYMVALEELEEYAEVELERIPSEKRFLVTNHDSFGYFAEEYGFTLLGTVIPSMSTLSEPSASDLTDLITEMEAYNVCTIFTETTLNDTLAKTVAGELDGCDEVQVLKLHTGAIGSAGSGTDSYIGMFQANVDAIVSGLNND